MNTTSFEQFEVMNTEVLASIEGGGDIYASAISGAAQGVMMCMQTGVAVQPLVMFGCAGAGAALSLIFPQ